MMLEINLLPQSAQESQVGLPRWLESFADLRVEEVYLDDERQLLE